MANGLRARIRKMHGPIPIDELLNDADRLLAKAYDVGHRDGTDEALPDMLAVMRAVEAQPKRERTRLLDDMEQRAKDQDRWPDGRE